MKQAIASSAARNSRIRSRDIHNRSQTDYTSTETSQSNTIVQIPLFNESELPNVSNVRIIARINAPISKQTQTAVPSKRSSSTASLRYAAPTIGSANPSSYIIVRPKHTLAKQDERVTRTRSRESLRSNSSISNTLSGHTNLQLENQYSVFTTTRKQSNLLILSENPISGRVISEQLHETKDLKYFLSVSLKSGFHSSIHNFDNVYNEIQKQDKFYKAEVQQMITSFIEGQNGCLLAFGPTSSGKTYTLQGKPGAQRGVIQRAVEDILQNVSRTGSQSEVTQFGGSQTNPIINLMTAQNFSSDQRTYLRGCVYMIHCDNIYDLLTTGNVVYNGNKPSHVRVECYFDQASQQIVTKIIGLHERLITSMEQFNTMIQDAHKERRTFSSKLTDHDIRKRSHLVVQLSLVNRLPIGFHELSQFNFVELAGSEQSVTSSDVYFRDSTVRQFVTKSFNSLSSHLIKVATSKKNPHIDGESPLINCLKQTLSQSSNILILNCSSPAAQQFQHTLPSVKFCSKIRETIVRRMERRHLKQQLEQETPKRMNPFATRFNQNVDLEDVEDISNKLNEIYHQLKEYINQIQTNQHKENFEEIRDWSIENLEKLDRITDYLKSSKQLESMPRVKSLKQQINELQEKLNSASGPYKTASPIPRLSQKATLEPYLTNNIKLNAENKEHQFNSVLRPSTKMSERHVEFQTSPEIQSKQHYGTFDGGYEPVTQLNNKSNSPRRDYNFSSHKQSQSYLELQEQLLSSQKVHQVINSIFQNPKRPKNSIYQSTEETITDIKRLIALEDFEGLQKRVVALTKERLSCEVMMDTQKVEIDELREQISARDTLVQQVESLNKNNILECTQQINQAVTDAEEKSREFNIKIVELESQLKEWNQQFQMLRSEKENVDQQLQDALQQAELHKKARQEAENKQKALLEQNEKITVSYEVLKDHELNIIKDFSDKTKETKQHLNQKLENLKATIKSKDEIIESQENERKEKDDQIRLLQFEITKHLDKQQMHQDQTTLFECRLEKQMRDIQDIQVKLGLAMAENEKKDNDIAKLQKENHKFIEQISELETLLNEREETVKVQRNRLQQKDDQLNQLTNVQNTINEQKRVADECIAMKNKEIVSMDQREKQLLENFQKLQTEYEILDRQHIRLKASEYDKVDVLKQNTDLQVTIRNQNQDLTHVQTEKDRMKNELNQKEADLENLRKVNQHLEFEIESLKRTHNESIGSFEKKFMQLSRELDQLGLQNAEMREREKTFKRKFHELEVENLEWREKYKYSEQRYTDQGKRLSEAINETRNFGYETQAKKNEFEESRKSSTTGGQVEPFGDIKSLISKFKQEREMYKEQTNLISTLANSQRFKGLMDRPDRSNVPTFGSHDRDD